MQPVDGFALGTAASREPQLDFSRAEVVRAFRVINDAVMGGVSTAWLGSSDGAMVFKGHVSLANGGGFASCRGPVRFPVQASALLLTVRGDAQRYKLTLKLDDNTHAAQYQAVFVAPREWATLRFVPADFKPRLRGHAVAAPIVRFADVQYVGLLISDKQSGDFEIELQQLRAE